MTPCEQMSTLDGILVDLVAVIGNALAFRCGHT